MAGGALNLSGPAFGLLSALSWGTGDFGAAASTVWGAAHETARRAGKLTEFDTKGRLKPNSAERQRVEQDYLADSKRLGRVYFELVKPGDRDSLLRNFRIQLRPRIDENSEIEMLTALPMDFTDPRTEVHKLFTAKPHATADELAKLLGVSRSTAWRRATEYGWNFDDANGVWDRA